MTKSESTPERLPLRALAIALIAVGAIAMPAAHAASKDDIVIVPPSRLPASAQRSGEGMFIHEATDGRTLLYIEQATGAGLAILDVTDPGHVKAEGIVSLDAPEAFDVTGTLGAGAALVQFRRTRTYAVLDLRDTERPHLKSIDGHPLQGSTGQSGAQGPAGARAVDAPSAPNQPASETARFDVASVFGLAPDYPVNGVRGRITIDATGTTFLLSDDGLYVVRRLSAEFANERRQISALEGQGG